MQLDSQTSSLAVFLEASPYPFSSSVAHDRGYLVVCRQWLFFFPPT